MRLFEFSEYARTLLGINIISNLFIMEDRPYRNSRFKYKFDKEISRERLDRVRESFNRLKKGDLVTLTFMEGGTQDGKITDDWISNDGNGWEYESRKFTYCDSTGGTKTVEIRPENNTTINRVSRGNLNDFEHVVEIKVNGNKGDGSTYASLCTISGGIKKKRAHATRKKRRRSAIKRRKSRKSRR